MPSVSNITKNQIQITEEITLKMSTYKTPLYIMKKFDKFKIDI